MTVWQQFSEIISRLPDAVSSVVEYLVEAVTSSACREHRRQVAFTAAMIALSAKMAKADGIVTAAEVAVVERLFNVPAEEKRNVARLFNLAKQDVAGYEYYARRIRSLYPDDPDTLADILDGLMFIAAADGAVHDRELEFLETVRDEFRLDQRTFARLMARHVETPSTSPYLVLGLDPGAHPDEVKRAWRRLASEHHPDKLLARGLPADFIRLATERMAAINAAYAAIARQVPA
jgi:DnaJ like chaperone protein